MPPPPPNVIAKARRPPATSAPAAQAPPTPPAELYELAITSCAMGFHQSGMDSLREVTERAPDHADAWRKLAELLRFSGNDAEAAAADAAADRIGDATGKWPKASGERSPTKIEKAERRLHEVMAKVPADNEIAVLRKRVFRDPADVVSMRYLALHEWREEDLVTAETLLERVLELSPGYAAARSDYLRLLQERRNYTLAVEEARRLLAQTPRDLGVRGVLAFSLAQTSRFAEAIDVLAGMVKDDPNTARFWVSLGNNLHFVGRNEESAAAYRKALALAPATAEAFSGLAALKGKHLTDDDVAAMRVHLGSGRLELSGKWHMSYALAQALERRKDYAGCFEALENGARAFRENYAGTRHAHEPEAAAERVRRLKKVFSAENLTSRAVPAAGPPPSVTPIMVVGMPRAGSTLLEQILASHSLVEGTRELPLMGDITRDLAHSRRLITKMAYPECVLDLTPEQLAALGERYIRNAAIYRMSDRPYFVDKRPWNWMDAGLIHLIMPHAKIIDIRREPMAACFAMFKQQLPVDAGFTYDLNHVGRYYNEYVGLMRHYEEVLPGRIHYLSYERLVEDTETEIRRLLDYCGLPFEEGCLRFWETDRAVVTPSAEQVRTPIFKDALQQWRNFEPWLGPLRAALEGG
jgi:tetratricopeptide (TPR) repeat protein